MFTMDRGQYVVPAGSPLRTHLAIQPASSGGTTATIELPAAVEADPARVANIVAPATGRLVALKVTLGERVRQGQPLAVMVSGDYAQARADVAKAEDALDLTSKALDRAKGVRQAGGAATKDLEAAESAHTQAEAELARARSRLIAMNGAATGHEMVLVAPQAGVVTALSTSQGSQIGDATATLMTIANLDRVFVTANVAEGDIGAVRTNTPVEIDLNAYPSAPLRGTVSEVDSVLSPDTRRLKVRVALPNPGGRLMPNMYGTVRLPVATEGAVFVPQSALLMNNDATSVLVEVRPWVFERRAVKVGEETETMARILSGLRGGERVVVRGGVLLND